MKRGIAQFVKNHFFLILFLAAYTFTTSYKFIVNPTPFYDWDEAIYAQVGREMINSKSLVPLWQGQFWLDKPPLTPLFYGLVMKVIPISPEISTRIATLFLTNCILILSYSLYFKASKDKAVALLTAIITAFAQTFLQRSQVLNVDAFLLIGWLGYLLFYSNFWIGLLFLSFGVLSKSLLGFYPVAVIMIYNTYLLLIKKHTYTQYKKHLINTMSQAGIITCWYLVMIVFFGSDFIKYHFLESHLKRVTASIESHFGKRTFYIDTIIEQFGFFSYLSIISFILLIRDYLKKQDHQKLLLALFFVPWFFFLNLTKTKISWYIYPVIPQFAFLSTYWLTYFRKIKLLQVVIAIFFIIFILNKNYSNNHFFDTLYSSYDQNYYLASSAEKHCKDLTVLVDPDSRNTHDVLKDMDLLISTSEWWGNHPSIVYYFGRKVNFVYSKKIFTETIKYYDKDRCLAVYDKDLDTNPQSSNFINIKKFDDLNLFKKR